jgi:hypothetical protein
MQASNAWAAPPSDVWSAANASGGVFSADGSSVLLTISGGFQMRRASDGVVEKTISLPAASLGYDAFAFSPNKQFVALTYRASPVTRIELFSVASGVLARTIQTGAVRNARGIDLSSQGLVAIFERWAYGGGGNIWVYRVADGSLVTSQGRYTRSSTTILKFAPDGAYLAINDSGVVGEEGVRILRTSDWMPVALARSAFPFSWAADSQTLWTSRTPFDSQIPFYEEVEVPSGEILTSTPIDPARYFPTAVTPDNRLFLAGASAANEVVFLRAADASLARRLSAPAGTRTGQVSPSGALFIYSVCGQTACTTRMARMPAL